MPKLQKFLVGILAVFIVFSFFIPHPFISAEELEDICDWERIKEKPAGLSNEEYKDLLKKCQDYYNQRSEEIDKDLNATKEQKDTLENMIWSLGQKIQSLDYKIKQGNIMIEDLTYQIKDTESSIEGTVSRIDQVKGSLADVLQLRYEKDQESLLEILLAQKNLSDFFDDVVALETINEETQELLNDIRNLKSNLEGQRQEMSEEKNELENLVTVQQIQKRESAENKQKQEYFLELTEKEYQNYLRKKQEVERKAAEISAKIYELIGVREAVTYEEALEIARYAASEAGIRPALLLGVLSQESSIGKNVGQCYLKDPETGSGVVVSSGRRVERVMKPTRDVPYFMDVIDALNNERGLAMNPFETLVSCPMSIGWGGAMGPAQFIPSTWVGAGYEKRVEQITGTAADPWDLKDASLAASLYLKDGISRYGEEGSAIQAYFCGSANNTYWCRWYERNVLYLASCHQTFIDKGQMSVDCQNSIGLR